MAVYAQWFDRVEVNSTYHATPRGDVITGWVEQTPARFRLDLKLHRTFSQNQPANRKVCQCDTSVYAHGRLGPVPDRVGEVRSETVETAALSAQLRVFEVSG